MTGLITRGDSLAARASASNDHGPQTGSAVAASRMTLVSTRTAAATSAPRQLHDLVCRHTAFEPSIHLSYALSPPRLAVPAFHDLHNVALHDEVDLRLGQEAQALADLLRNRDLALGCNLHAGILLLP